MDLVRHILMRVGEADGEVDIQIRGSLDQGAKGGASNVRHQRASGLL